MFVVLGHDGLARIERGFVRPEDAPVEEPEAEAEDEPRGGGERVIEPEEDDGDAAAPLSERLVLDLTAQRTMALRDALGSNPTVALSAVVHALALGAFYPCYDRATCLEVKLTSAPLDGHAPGIADTRAGRSLAERHERWAVRLPKGSGDLWAVVQGLPATDLLDLLAHCASLTVNAVRTSWDRKPGAWGHADRVAEAVDLDMSGYWAVTVGTNLGRVTKAQIGEAVREGVSTDAAERISGMKKPDMASEAETLLAGKNWLPSLLRAVDRVEADVQPEVPRLDQEAA